MISCCFAERSQGSPREISRHVELMQTFFPELRLFGQEQVEKYLESSGIDKCGLKSKQREYLKALYVAPQQRSSLERLKVKIGVDFMYLRRDIEPFLIDSGYVEVTTARSRKLTESGQNMVNEERGMAG